MTLERPSPLLDLLLALADDELILGHRQSEWTGHAPILEEDIAFANLALDELGHGGLWYSLAAELAGTTPDRLVFFREAAAFRNVQLVELPRGDWAFSMLRQFLFDAAEAVRLPLLAESRHAGIAAAAAKIRTEELYHLRHTGAWVKRLGLGTPESHTRMQAALDTLWPYALQLFVPLPGEAELAREGVAPAAAQVEQAWRALLLPRLEQAGLNVPAISAPAATSRARHTPGFIDLVTEMQSVARLEAREVVW